MGSYAPWRRVMGGILRHAGVPGLLHNLKSKTSQVAPDVETFELICENAVERWGEGQPWMTADLAEVLTDNEVEVNFGRPVHDRSSLNIQLGIFLKKRMGQIVDGYELVQRPRNSKGHPWAFVAVEDDE